MQKVILSTSLAGIPVFKKGKVRDVYDLQDKLLIISTDRISAFDVIMPNGIPCKGRVLTSLSAFWFDYVKDIIDNHLISADINEIIGYEKRLASYKDVLEGRSMLVKKANAIPVECVVRGYLAGSGWKEYKDKGSICGIPLPRGLKEADRLPEPIFTPATKAESGHDINITQDETKRIIGEEIFKFLMEKSIAIYKKASEYASEKGIIISDTKFELGKLNNKIILIDELFTPDSSRFWPKDDYKPGRTQKSFDKQFLRDYLETLDWDKAPPAPELPEEIITKTMQKYLKAYEMIIGKKLSIL